MSDAKTILQAVQQIESACGSRVQEIRTAEGVVFTHVLGIPIVVDRECPPNQWYFLTTPIGK
jgi:hypothetical protein